MSKLQSLENKLVVRISVILIGSFSVILGWLWVHLFILHEPLQTSSHQQAFMELFSNVGWVVPVMMLATIFVTAHTLRRSLKPLRHLSRLTAQIKPKSLHQRLPVRDLPSEVAPMVKAINAMLSGIEDGFTTQRHFTENVAHELRTPLQVLGAGLEDLQQTPQVIALRGDLDKMARSVDQILAISRLETRSEEQEKVTDLNAVAVTVLSYIAPLATKKNVRLSLEKEAGPLWVQGDSALIGDLLRNLVENALAVCPPNAGICVRINPTGTLDVIDEGPGIPSCYRDKIFQRFWRLPDSKVQGTGLGLAIVKDIAMRCRAGISIHDNPGGGSVFRVVFASATALTS
ncbi:Signal transduction histidine kinase [Pseudovibrio ascidiaceicola]|uniref:histidine kinase n=1 Tax=Pseudovibrio ascidiaceicola TaxID=285279 RepID=A0A1I4G1Q9_9HYPH|nr:Signal transduction histidine kinase [Pseudovibrio ascidiaceicola]